MGQTSFSPDAPTPPPPRKRDLNASAMAAGRTTVTPKTVNNEGAVVIEEKAQEHVAYY